MTATSAHTKANGKGAHVAAIPFDPVNEQIVIAAAIVDRATRDSLVARIEAGAFFSDDHRAIWRALREMSEKQLAADPATLKAILGTHVRWEYVESLVDNRPDVPENLDWHVQALAWDRVRGDAAKPISALLDALKDPNEAPERVRMLGLRVAEALSKAPTRPRFEFVSAADLASPLPPTPYVCRHFGIAPGRPTLLAGYGGRGKTIVAQELGYALAAGLGSWAGVPIVSAPSVRVIHLDYEMTLAPVQRRYQRLAFTRVPLSELGDRLRVASMPSVYLSRAEAEDALVEACTGVTVAIIDSLFAACPDAKSENDASMRVYLDLLTRVSAKTGCVFVVIHHEGKPPKDGKSHGDAIHRVRGASAITDACGTVITIGVRDGILTLEHAKASLGKAGAPLHVRIEDAGTADFVTGEHPGLHLASVSVEDERDPSVDAAKASIVAALRKHGPLTHNLLMATASGRTDSKRKAIKELLDEGSVVAGDGPRRSKVYRLVQLGEATNAR